MRVLLAEGGGYGIKVSARTDTRPKNSTAQSPRTVAATDMWCGCVECMLVYIYGGDGCLKGMKPVKKTLIGEGMDLDEEGSGVLFPVSCPLHSPSPLAVGAAYLPGPTNRAYCSHVS